MISLQSRVYDKLLTFAHKNNDNSPSELKENIRLVVQDEKSTNELTQATYELRGGTIIKKKSLKRNTRDSPLNTFSLDC